MGLKIVINTCYGGFDLSDEALNKLYELKSEYVIYQDGDLRLKLVYEDDVFRTDSNLVKIVEELGERSWGPYANLKVVEIPENIGWEIQEFDGIEEVHEIHRSWF